MANTGRAKAGRTLAGRLRIEGSADLSRLLAGYTLRRTALAGVALASFMAGIAASSAVLQGEADPGVVAGMPGSYITAVSPTGFAWRDGVRPGQLVISLTAADDPGGWRLQTTDGSAFFVSEAAQANTGLRASLPLVLAALGISLAAVLLLRARRRWVLPTASIALLLASYSLALHGNPMLSTLGLGAAAFVPAGWIVARLPGGIIKSALLALALLGFLAAWGVARLDALGDYDSLDWIRGNLALWGTAALVLERAAVWRTAGDPMPLIRPRPFDVAALALIAGGALALVNLFAISPVLIAVAAAGAVVAVPRLRRTLQPLEKALLADVREQAASQAAELERGKLARELHDVPLQELFGVIRRLEIKPGTESESDDLRALASHLRNVAIELRPPVLDDLGLAAALEYLADGATRPECPVLAEVGNHAGLGRAQRPPEEVELAMFRIATEAVGNALAHSGASRIVLRAEVDPSRVDLTVSDDGGGLEAAAARAASRQRHMGLSSMRHRAEAIDAELQISGSRSGTHVRVVWQG